MKFNSSQAALRWAYERLSKPVVGKTASMGNLINLKDSGSEHDAIGEATIILRLCDGALSEIERAYVELRFGRVRMADSLTLLCNHLIPKWGTGVHKKRLMLRVLIMYFNFPEKVTVLQLRQEMRCSTQKAVERKRIAFLALDELGDRLASTLYREFKKVGICT